MYHRQPNPVVMELSVLENRIRAIQHHLDTSPYLSREQRITAGLALMGMRERREVLLATLDVAQWEKELAS